MVADGFGPLGHPRRRSGWYVELPAREEYDTEALVRELLCVVEPYAEGIALACRTLKVVPGINVVVEMHSVRDEAGGLLVTTPALSLRGDTLRRIADLGCRLDCDQYVY